MEARVAEEEVETGLGSTQPVYDDDWYERTLEGPRFDWDDDVLSLEELLPHEHSSHDCHEDCEKWYLGNPDFPESCGDED